MEPDVFEALLQFIYTDSLMPLDSFDYRSANELIRHLLRAADRYGMARLKNICEMKLCTTIDVERIESGMSSNVA
ncbi:hypothetical protein E2562_032067 [Oryza meyeriana var. granulata]|uniref:BTB domain-containing protein n=1 Tax=Oryza meyeriana var. granulata TaxID=110450 RepID=A0A6G1CJW6_9ORYZ|nr:hypothetical protein E2562_032067 [Oryza meyeriana var. granulata]